MTSISGQQLVDRIQDGLGDIQAAFKVYQHEFFIERPPEFFALELCGEAGELANLEKKRWRGQSISDEATADEAADVLISLINFANARGIDLTSAVVSKLSRIPHSK
jgi:NTP pyrophosphatase (non-canonical NTP hydrolase)